MIKKVSLLQWELSKERYQKAGFRYGYTMSDRMIVVMYKPTHKVIIDKLATFILWVFRHTTFRGGEMQHGKN